MSSDKQKQQSLMQRVVHNRD